MSTNYDKQQRGALSLPLRSINHVSRICKDVRKSARFYRDVLGFVEVKRPSSFTFEGAWLYNYNIGIHLIEGDPQPKPARINPKSEHWSFQCESLADVEHLLRENGIEYVTDTLHEGHISINQIFFHDPDNNMIEICNCDCMPMIPVHHPTLENDVVAFHRAKRSATADNNRHNGMTSSMPLSARSQTPGGLLAGGPGNQ